MNAVTRRGNCVETFGWERRLSDRVKSFKLDFKETQTVIYYSSTR